jgi:hypothetical protein
MTPHPFVYDVAAQDGFCTCGRPKADPIHRVTLREDTDHAPNYR